MTSKERRAVTLGFGVLVVAWLGLRGLPAVVRLVGTLHNVALDRMAMLQRARDVAAATPTERDSLTKILSAIVALAPALVDGTSGPDAQASLAGWLSATANRQRVKVLKLDPLPDSAAGVFGRVAVHGEFEGDVHGLVGVLRSIETQMPLLTVNTLAVDAADPVGHRGAPEVLHLEATVSGFYLPRASTRP